MSIVGAPWSLEASIAGFVVAAAVIGIAGVRLASIVDRLADRTGIGEALAGAVLPARPRKATQASPSATRLAASQRRPRSSPSPMASTGKARSMRPVETADVFVIGWTMALVAILGAGLVRRQQRGSGIGFEGIGILALYAAGVAVVSSIG